MTLSLARVPGMVPRPAILRVSRGLMIAGLMGCGFIAYELLFSGLWLDQAQLGLVAQFKRDVQTTQLSAPDLAPAEGAAVAMLRIPSIGLDRAVVEGSSARDLDAGPGHLRVSPLPGEFGNSVIISRHITHGGTFGRLDQLKVGDPIRVTTGQGVFTYKVTQVTRPAVDDPRPLSATLDSRLTLLTADPALLANGRLAVVAMLQGTPLAVPQRLSAAARAEDLGLNGDPSWIGPALLWGQLLALALWLAWRQRRRWPPSVSLMFAMPPLLGLLVLTFSSFDRALPGAI